MTWTWLSLAGLGAVHGLNPGMGWLFAVALGMQEGRTRAVWRALPPLALGHALAIAAAVLGAAAVGQLLPPRVLVWIVGGMLLGLGALRLARHRHPRYGGMQVGFRDLTFWSFLLASAYGADLMLLPVLLGSRTVAAADYLAGAITCPRPLALWQHCSPPRSIRVPIWLSLGSSRGWSIGSSASRFFVRPGSISTWHGVQRSWSPAWSLC